jgi:hypothetical protein
LAEVLAVLRKRALRRGEKAAVYRALDEWFQYRYESLLDR